VGVELTTGSKEVDTPQVVYYSVQVKSVYLLVLKLNYIRMITKTPIHYYLPQYSPGSCKKKKPLKNRKNKPTKKEKAKRR
jgi:hypothetical protein